MLKPREAKPEDSQLIYNWNTEPESRANSFSTSLFSFEEHNVWYLSKIKDPGAFFIIFTDDAQKEVGLVRIEKKETEWLIGITIDKEARGKGYASEMISKASENHFSKYHEPIIAQIKNTNIASVKAFLKAGYKFDRNLLINNIPSSQYIYENS